MQRNQKSWHGHGKVDLKQIPSDKKKDRLKQVYTFKYLGSMINGGSLLEHRINGEILVEAVNRRSKGGTDSDCYETEKAGMVRARQKKR